MHFPTEEECLESIQKVEGYKNALLQQQQPETSQPVALASPQLVVQNPEHSEDAEELDYLESNESAGKTSAAPIKKTKAIFKTNKIDRVKIPKVKV